MDLKLEASRGYRSTVLISELMSIASHSGLISEDSPYFEIPAKIFPESSGYLYLWIFVCICSPYIIGVLLPTFIMLSWWFLSLGLSQLLKLVMLILHIARTLLKQMIGWILQKVSNIIKRNYSNVLIRIGEVTIHKDEKLGSGMFGYVFKGKFKEHKCAIKVLHEIGMELILDTPNTPNNRKIQDARVDSFNNEYRYLLNLRHPNIVKLFHVCAYPQTNYPCLVMELLDCSLRDYLAQTSGDLSLRIQISLSCDVGKALAYLHEAKVIHRDLCGDNVLIQKDDAVPVAKIADFGMCRITDPERMTHSLSVLHHRNGYLPPEGPSKEYDLSLDIHMFGVIMIQTVRTVKNVDSPEMREELLKKISEIHPLKKIIESCVAKNKEDRPTAESISKELQKMSLETH